MATKEIPGTTHSLLDLINTRSTWGKSKKEIVSESSTNQIRYGTVYIIDNLIFLH